MKDTIEAELKNILSRRQGREFLAWLMFDVCGMLRSSFATNALINSHREGERNVGLRLHAELERVSPEDLMKMYGEFAHVRREQRKSGTRDDKSGD